MVVAFEVSRADGNMEGAEFVEKLLTVVCGCFSKATKRELGLDGGAIA